MVLSAARCCSLLQVLDDGRITNAQGHTVNLRNAVVDHDLQHRFGHLLDGVTGEVVVAVVPAVAIELVTNIGEG
jgi:hypothetical protein